MKKVSLNGEYTLRYRSVYERKDWAECETVRAQVPGNVEIDLMKAGILPDIYFGSNVLQLKKWEFCEWRYEREFEAEAAKPGERQFLHFEGVDCIADYRLNGERIAHTENALIDHRIEVTGKLRPRNTLEIEIFSPMEHAQQFPVEARDWAYHVNYEGLNVRKAPSQYGWDIAPRILSAGLWRSVWLETEGTDEILEYYFATLQANEKQAKVTFSYNVRCSAKYLVGMSLRITGRTADGRGFDVEKPIRFVSGRFDIRIEKPALWWPHGYGEPNLYDVRIELLVDGRAVAQEDTKIGVRKVELERTDWTDTEGGEFLFRVNGEPVMCKGSNWVPADMLHSRDAARYEKMLDLFRDTGCNIVRCWGGNVYEDHAFFDLCDRYGIMVWQDFAMACASYPQTERFMAALREEAESVVRKLRNHPSLILWSGDNECDVHMCAAIKVSPEKNRLTREVLPQVIERLDPMREYLPSSPYVSKGTMERWRDKRRPTPRQAAWPASEPYKRYNTEDHPWGARDYYKAAFYQQINVHFISEIGYHGCNSVSSIRSFISPDKLWPWQDNDEWLVHASEMTGKTGPYAYRIQLMADQVTEVFGIQPDNLYDFALASQIVQAEAKKFFIESTRMAKWRRTGVIWWNMIDGWPQFSDAVVSYDFIRKLAYYYIKRSQQPVCMMLDEPVDWNVALHVGNDTLKDAEGSYTVWDGETGEILAEGEYFAPANQTACLRGIRLSRSAHRLVLMKWDVGGKTCFNHFIMASPPMSFERYKKWLRLIAQMDGLFDADEIAR